MAWVWFQLGARNERAAARVGAWLFLASATVVIFSNLLVKSADEANARALAVGGPAPLLLYGFLLAWPRFRYKQPLLTLTPVLAVVFITWLSLATNDSSAGAQVAFCLPIIFAASQLRPIGALVAMVSALVGEVVLVTRLDQSKAGTLDIINVSLVLLLMTGILESAMRRQAKLVSQLEAQASFDTLTGLVTRRVLDEAVERALGGAPVPAGAALILVDIDHFKGINDTHGHPVGDDVLVHLAKVLTANSRPDTIISRLGGDEVAIFLPACTEAGALECASRYLRAVNESPLELHSSELLTMSVSIGLAHAPYGMSGSRTLYTAADASLYTAKRSGRGRVGSICPCV